MIVLAVIACIILAIRSNWIMKHNPDQIGKSISDLAYRNHPQLIIRMEAHRKNMELIEARTAKENNTVVEGDLKIELLKLKIIAAEKELGIYGDTSFNPSNYPGE